MKKIPLTQGQVALVDDADYPTLSKFKWSARWCPDSKAYYAIATVSMGRLVLGLTDPRVKADHKNHDTLDNRRSNLRAATHAQNRRNLKGPHSNSKSGVRGVSWHKQMGKWHAWIRVDGKIKSLGLFKRIDAATEARRAGSAKYHGDFAGRIVAKEKA